MTNEQERFRAEGATLERSRIKQILSSPDAAKHPLLASDLAFRQSISVEAALGQLRGLTAAGRIDSGAANWDDAVALVNAEQGRHGATAPDATGSLENWDGIAEAVNAEHGFKKGTR